MDARADVFGLGALLAVILTGEPPFGFRAEAAQGRTAACFARLDRCGAEPELVALCKRCLAPEKADRPADASEVARAVAEFRAAAKERVRRAERDGPKAEQRKRRRVQLALAGAVALLLLGSGALAWWADRRASEQKMEAGRADAERADRNRG